VRVPHHQRDRKPSKDRSDERQGCQLSLVSWDERRGHTHPQILEIGQLNNGRYRTRNEPTDHRDLNPRHRGLAGGQRPLLVTGIPFRIDLRRENNRHDPKGKAATKGRKNRTYEMILRL
jgi:hypothetical protein